MPLQTPEDVAEQVLPFDPETTRLMKAVGSLAAVAIDNYRLDENIERLFEGFVQASVTAIEQRDPTTSGHSLRFSILTVDLVEKVHRLETGPYAAQRFTEDQFRELRYAASLHDFGKVGVREQVLVKAKKLYPFELGRVLTRFELARLYHERDLQPGDGAWAAALPPPGHGVGIASAGSYGHGHRPAPRGLRQRRADEPPGGRVTLTVQDTGQGIPEENLARIFGPFFTTKPPGQGTGLGLALCHSIVHRLGGEITVASEPGAGAACTVRLPILLMEDYA